MQQITIRGLAPEVEQKIRQNASDNHKSINQVLKEIIHKEFGIGKRKPRGATLRKLAGGWSKEMADEFVLSIQSCAQIDEEMWR
jgi:plasmid stability protein